MTEESVFWLGGRPQSATAGQHLADTPEFVAAIRSACEAVGAEVQQFVSAKGPYGTWLVAIRREGADERILWNGKDRTMVLQTALAQGGWEDTRVQAAEPQDTGAFVAALRSLLSAS